MSGEIERLRAAREKHELAERGPNTNLARIRVEYRVIPADLFATWKSGPTKTRACLVCQECQGTVHVIEPGDRADIIDSYIGDHVRACVGHPSGVHYLDRG